MTRARRGDFPIRLSPRTIGRAAAGEQDHGEGTDLAVGSGRDREGDQVRQGFLGRGRQGEHRPHEGGEPEAQRRRRRHVEGGPEAAKAADKALAKGEAVGPLHGVPVTIKINLDVKGQANSNGVVAFKDNIAPDNSAVTANLRKAGAVIISLANTPEFSMRGFTENPLHGLTLNPWDHKITCGGS